MWSGWDCGGPRGSGVTQVSSRSRSFSCEVVHTSLRPSGGPAGGHLMGVLENALQARAVRRARLYVRLRGWGAAVWRACNGTQEASLVRVLCLGAKQSSVQRSAPPVAGPAQPLLTRAFHLMPLIVCLSSSAFWNYECQKAYTHLTQTLAGSNNSVAEALLANTESQSSRDDLPRAGSNLDDLDGSHAGACYYETCSLFGAVLQAKQPKFLLLALLLYTGACVRAHGGPYAPSCLSHLGHTQITLCAGKERDGLHAVTFVMSAVRGLPPFLRVSGLAATHTHTQICATHTRVHTGQNREGSLPSSVYQVSQQQQQQQQPKDGNDAKEPKDADSTETGGFGSVDDVATDSTEHKVRVF
eukprot:1158341-Pelagomonas_calceolata.AAC.8